jgi:hypothetical protein
VSEIKPETGFSYSVSAGKLDTIRGAVVPQGTVAVLGVDGVSASGREFNSRAIQMTVGLFRFAELSNREDPSGAAK